MRFAVFAVFLFFAVAAEAGGPRVVVSTPPLHSVVCAVMKGIGTPELLLPANVSPHDYRLKPSDMKKLSDADVVFWNGKMLEGFLPKALEAADASGKSISVMQGDGILLLKARPLRKGGQSAGIDPHFWLMPDNMGQAALIVAKALSRADGEHAALYLKNAESFKARMTDLTKEIKDKFKGMKGGNFLFFHDAFLYFERVSGLNSIGAVETSGASAGAGRLIELRDRIATAGKTCLFVSPQFSKSRISVLTEGLSVQIGEADPTGIGLVSGENFYTDLMHKLIQSIYDCLKGIE